MTIHHDKLAFGKLASNMEELSVEQINEMLKQLNEEGEEDLSEEKQEKTDKNK